MNVWYSIDGGARKNGLCGRIDGMRSEEEQHPLKNRK